MARKTDINKLDAIKRATIETVVLEGVTGASISKIATKANVSVGYLYLFYKGKRKLLEALFKERFSIIHQLLLQEIENQSSIKDIITVFVKQMYSIAEKEPKSITFMYKLLSDFSFQLPEELKKNMNEICTKIIKLGSKTGEIDTTITNEALYAVMVGGLINYINIRLRNIFEISPLNEKDIEYSIQILYKTLAKNT